MGNPAQARICQLEDEVDRLRKLIVEYATAKENDEILCKRADQETADGSDLSDELSELLSAAGARRKAAAVALHMAGKELAALNTVQESR